MNVSESLQKRVSTRAFLDKPIPQETLETILSQAQQAPSNCNTQPWQVYVVSGETKDRLAKAFLEALMSGAAPNPDFNWNAKYEGIHRERQFGSAAALYDTLGIDRSDRQARNVAMARNWNFFGAPHALFFVMEKYLDVMGAVDTGIYAQSLALLLTEHGLASCMQGALSQYPDPARDILGIPESQGVLFGMSIGYADEDAKVNTTRTDRVELGTAVKFFS